MKTIAIITTITGALLTACSSSFRATSEYDDIYYTPSSEPAVVRETVVTPTNERPVSNYERYISSLENQDNNTEFIQDPDTMQIQRNNYLVIRITWILNIMKKMAILMIITIIITMTMIIFMHQG